VLTKSIIGVLLCGLVAVVGLFLYSDYPLEAKKTKDVTVSNTTQTIPAKTNSTSTLSGVDTSANTDDDTALVVQPDKSLPIPAHKLQKLISDKPSTTELDQKIQATNNAIATLDKSLPQQAATTEPTALSTAKVTDEKSEDINKRLQHLRDHVNKEQP
jgi:hypothetical protein